MRKLFFIALVAIAAISAKAQTNFSGTYVINKSKIDFGKAPEWVLPSAFEVVQNGDKLTISRTTVDQAGKETTRKLDFQPGQATDYTTSSGDKNECLVAWAGDHSSFTLSVQSTKADGSAGQNYKEVWSLADNGHTLIIDRQVAQANGMKYAIKAVYDKK